MYQFLFLNPFPILCPNVSRRQGKFSSVGGLLRHRAVKLLRVPRNGTEQGVWGASGGASVAEQAQQFY